MKLYTGPIHTTIKKQAAFNVNHKPLVKNQINS